MSAAVSATADRGMPPRLLLLVLLPFSAGYFLSYMYRAVNAIVAPDLVRDIGLDAAQLGLVTAAYLVAFALFQLPLGLLLDRFGPRRVQAALLLCAALGSVLFALSDSAVQLAAARALIGLGFAGGLMAGFKAVVLWFHPSRHALANACIMCVGGLGMLAASVPAEMLVQVIGWRGAFVASAVLTATIGILIFVLVPEPDVRPVARSLATQLRDVVLVYTDAYFWRVAPLVALTAGAQIAIHTLWAGPWFSDLAGLDRDGVALRLLLMALAFVVGTLLAGALADRLGRRGIDPLRVMLGGLGLFLLAQLAIVAEVLVLATPLWALFAMTGQAGILAYPVLARHFGAERSGCAHTAINLLLFMTAFLAQAFIGAVIDQFPAAADGGYASAGYRSAFGILLLLQLAAGLWYLLRRVPARAGVAD